MNERICSVRVLSCASISGTVSGIGSGTSAGSIPDEAVVGVGGVATGGGATDGVATGGVVLAGAALVIVAVGSACGSFEYAGKVKSNRLSLPVAVNFTSAYISVGSGSLPMVACRYLPLRTSEYGVSLPVLGSFTISVAL